MTMADYFILAGVAAAFIGVAGYALVQMIGNSIDADDRQFLLDEQDRESGWASLAAKKQSKFSQWGKL